MHSILGLDEELQQTVFSGKVNMENVLWIHRSFTGLDIDLHHNSLWKYMDLTPEGLFDDRSNTKLKNINNQLNDKIEPSNRLDIELEWSGYDIISKAMELGGYLEKLFNKYKEMLRSVIKRVLEEKANYDSTRIKMFGKGKYLTDNVMVV